MAALAVLDSFPGWPPEAAMEKGGFSAGPSSELPSSARMPGLLSAVREGQGLAPGSLDAPGFRPSPCRVLCAASAHQCADLALLTLPQSPELRSLCGSGVTNSGLWAGTRCEGKWF